MESFPLLLCQCFFWSIAFELGFKYCHHLIGKEKTVPGQRAGLKIVSLLQLNYKRQENIDVVFNINWFLYLCKPTGGKKKNHQTGTIGTVGKSFVNWLI